jgi:TPR repeat protein
MQVNRPIWIFLGLLLVAVVTSRAQENDYSAKMIAEIKAKAETGNAEAQLELAKCYKNGNGVKKDDAEAAKWCRKAAEQGVADAALNLGTCYEFGEGVQKDMGEAAKWYRKAADRGLPEAQCNLAIFYAAGKGIAKSEPERPSGFGELPNREMRLPKSTWGFAVSTVMASARMT